MIIQYSLQAEDDLDALGRAVTDRIRAKMRWFASQKEPLRFSKPLTALPGRYRFRIGDYRAIVTPDGIILHILRIAHRKDVYRR